MYELCPKCGLPMQCNHIPGDVACLTAQNEVLKIRLDAAVLGRGIENNCAKCHIPKSYVPFDRYRGVLQILAREQRWTATLTAKIEAMEKTQEEWIGEILSVLSGIYGMASDLQDLALGPEADGHAINILGQVEGISNYLDEIPELAEEYVDTMKVHKVIGPWLIRQVEQLPSGIIADGVVSVLKVLAKSLSVDSGPRKQWLEEIISACSDCDDGMIEVYPPNSLSGAGDPICEHAPCPYCGDARAILAELDRQKEMEAV